MSSVQGITPLCKNVENAIRSVLGNEAAVLHEPEFGGREIEYVTDCIKTGWVSSVGSYVDSIEKCLAEFTGAKYAVAVVNGTAALHTSLKLLNVAAEDEVLMPALTFIATANAVTYLGAKCHFVDISSRTLGVCPQKLRKYLSANAQVKNNFCENKKTKRKIKALIVVHIFGHSAELDELNEVCIEFGIALVEDAAESLGTYYKGRHTGTFGKLGTLSFNGNKIMTTGGGGAILTNDEATAKRAKHLTTTAKIPHPWDYVHDESGFNYRMPNLNAALGCAQLEQMPRFIEAKRVLAAKYEAAFVTVKGVHFLTEPSFSKSNYWLNTLIITEEEKPLKEELLKYLNQKGFMSRPAWRLMHKLSMFKDCPRDDLSISESFEARVINIPSSVKLAARMQ